MSNHTTFFCRIQNGTSKNASHLVRVKAVPAGAKRKRRSAASLAYERNLTVLRAVLGLSLAAVLTPSASAQFVISDSPGLFTPSFRGGAGTTYFGWGVGQWDGNLADETVAGEFANPFPSINPGALPGSLLNQTTPLDILASSNNVYSSVGGINTAGLTLTIPTNGTVGLGGFTTIIIQGKGLNGSLFGLDAGLDSFTFGTINGAAPDYIYGTNSVIQGQWWAKWELPGNAATYNVNINGYSAGIGVLSVTDMIVDTQWSGTAFAPDTAVAAPEPSAALMLLSGSALLGMLRRRRSLTE